MKLVAIFMLCTWLTILANDKPRNLASDSKLTGEYVQSDCDLESRYQGQPIEITHWNSLNVFRFLMEHPLARWDCFLYEKMTKDNKKESDIAKVEPRIAIFSWLDRYDSETETAKDKISINSIIACAFWPVTGLPTFIALILLFVGADEAYVHIKSEDNKQDEQQNVQMVQNLPQDHPEQNQPSNP